MLQHIDDIPHGIRGLSAGDVPSPSEFKEALAADTDMVGPRRVLFDPGAGAGAAASVCALAAAAIGETPTELARCAVLQDHALTLRAVDAAREVAPFSVRAFPRSERDAAIEWLRRQPRPGGVSLRLQPGVRALLARVHGPLEVEDHVLIERALRELDTPGTPPAGLLAIFSRRPQFRTVGALRRHLLLARRLRRDGRRVALVTRGVPASVGAALFCAAFPNAARFSDDSLDRALAWAAPDDPETSGAGRNAGRDPVDAAGLGSFPASDPPNYEPPDAAGATNGQR